jgi:hypothetical protein
MLETRMHNLSPFLHDKLQFYFSKELTPTASRRILQPFLAQSTINQHTVMQNTVYVSSVFYFYYYAFDPGG